MNLDKKFIELEKRLDKIEKLGEKTVAKNYKKLLEDLRSYIAEIYERYEKDGKLTFDEMVKYNRLDKLEKQIQELVNEAYKSNNKAIKGTLEDIAKETYTNTLDITSQGSGRQIRAVARDLPVEQIVNEDMKGLTWVERMGKHRSDAIWDIQKEIKQGLREGDTYGTMASRLRKRIETDRNGRIMAIVRTESQKVRAAAREESLDTIEKAGIQFQEKWITMSDERVRSSHASMDGVTITRGEDFILPDGSRCFGPGDPSLPAAEIINCRCFKVLVLDEPIQIEAEEEWEFVEAENIEEVTQRISEALGIENVKLGNMDMEIANQYLDGVETFTNDYPMLKGFIMEFNTKAKGNTVGHYLHHIQDIEGSTKQTTRTELSMRSPKDVAQFIKSINDSIKSGHFFEGHTPKTLMIHELTHAMDSMISAVSHGVYNDGEFTAIRGQGHLDGISGTIIREAYEETFGKRVGREVYNGTKYLGKYAMTKNGETLAEAIAYEYSGKTQPFSANVKKIFDRKIKEVFK